MRKVMLSYLLVSVLFLSVFSGAAVQAAEDQDVIVKPESEFIPISVATLGASVESNDGEISTRSVPSYVSKKTLKWAINNTTKITNVVGKYFGPKAAKNVGNVMNGYVKPVLRQLERLDKVTYGKLETTIYNAMAKPLGKTAAKAGAKAIVTVIKMIAPL